MPAPPPTPLPAERTLGGVLGVEHLERTEDRATGRLPIADRVMQPMGLVHGGAYAVMAEELASAATGEAVYSDGMIAVGLSNHTSFLRPAGGGMIHAEAIRRHRGRTTWLWEVELTDGDGRLCALARVTMAVRPLPVPSS